MERCDVFSKQESFAWCFASLLQLHAGQIPPPCEKNRTVSQSSHTQISYSISMEGIINPGDIRRSELWGSEELHSAQIISCPATRTATFTTKPFHLVMQTVRVLSLSSIHIPQRTSSLSVNKKDVHSALSI